MQAWKLAYVEVAVHDTGEGVERRGVNEERWDEVDLARRFRVLSKFCTPATRNISSVTEIAGLSGKRRHKCLAVHSELRSTAREV